MFSGSSTGLGNSDGDFADTNFSSNRDDLVAAADDLAQTYAPPQLLIGHSLGGAAVLAAAHRLEAVRAVVTIGAPSVATHVRHLFADHAERIVADDAAEFDLGGRRFTIKKQFLDDLDRWNTTAHLAQLRRALPVLHSPVDTIVPIDHIAASYQAAKHPKSFVSLDRADHLLSHAQDSTDAAGVIAAWVARYLEADAVAEQVTAAPGEVLVTEQDRDFLRGVHTASHHFVVDEPPSVGGGDAGSNPYDLLLAALRTCTSMTLRRYANRKALPLEDVVVSFTDRREHCADSAECDSGSGYLGAIDREIELVGPLNPAARGRLLEIADRCPVHRTLENRSVVKTVLKAG